MRGPAHPHFPRNTQVTHRLLGGVNALVHHHDNQRTQIPAISRSTSSTVTQNTTNNLYSPSPSHLPVGEAEAKDEQDGPEVVREDVL